MTFDALPRLAVVTVTYNSSAVLPPFLASFRAQTDVDAHLYVVDNASTDGSARIVADEAGLPATIVHSGANLGVAEGNNLGIRRALDDGAEWILLLNNDTEFAPGTLRRLLDVAVENDVTVLSPVIDADEPAGTIWYSGGTLHPWQGFRAVHDGAGALSVSAPTDVIRPTSYAPTCALLVHARVFAEAGMMDASYFVYYDDVDFCIRARAAGHGYHVTGAARILHKAGSITGRSRSAFTAKWGVRNWVLVARRHAPSRPALWMSLAYIQMHLVAGGILARDPMWRARLRQRWFWRALRIDLDDHRVPDLAS